MSIKTAQSEIMRLTAENIAIRRDLEAAKLREAELREELEIAKRCINREDYPNIQLEALFSHKHLDPKCCAEGCQSLIVAEPQAALAERDRAIEKRTAERCLEMLALYPYFYEEEIEMIRREFNLEPKPEGE